MERAAFKQGQIRYVQIGLTYDFFRYVIRKQPNDASVQSLMKTTFPKNTVHRFEYLHQNGHLSLSDQEVSDICDSYQYFIWLTHQGEYLCTHKNQTEYDISKHIQEISERTQSLKNIFGKESQNGIMRP